MATEPLGPADPGAQDECATCGHVRWTHDNPGVAGLCPSFVELSYGTRMARFVEAAQGLSLAMVGVRAAMTEAFRAANRLQQAMQQAGLLPEEDPAGAVGKHARDAAVATLAEALDVPAEMLTGPGPDGVPDHWAGAAPLRQPADWHTVGCDKRCGGTCMDLTADPHPIGSGPIEHHHPAEAEPESTQVIAAVRPKRARTMDDLHGPMTEAATGVAADIAVRYCPDCGHPYSYAAEGTCCMPVNAQTGLPVAGPNEPTRRCNCTTQAPTAR